MSTTTYTVTSKVTISPQAKHWVKIDGLPTNAIAIYHNKTDKSVELEEGEKVDKNLIKVIAITCTEIAMEVNGLYGLKKSE